MNDPIKIFYGLLSQDVEWDGAKAENGKMVSGMYPIMEDDIHVMLNPTGVDGTAYTYEFRASDNEKLWGLSLGEAEVYAGDKLTTDNANSRATVSPSGIWVIPRELGYVKTNDLDERADYISQFKSNDDKEYAFALQATNKEGKAITIKSQYLYAFDPFNVNNLKAKDFKADSEKKYYVYNTWYTPDFDALQQSYRPEGTTETFDISLSQVIYDYKLSIDKTKMTQVKIDEYGLEISDDKHSFNAKNAQAVNNQIYLTVDYILINGQKGTASLTYNIVNKDIVVENATVNVGSHTFDATFAENMFTTALNDKYVYAPEAVNFDPETIFGANYNDWVDAMYEGLKKCSTDDAKAVFLKELATVVGGDPINNDAEYNKALMANFIYLDYVDADGKSCIYGVKSGEELKRLQEIKKLVVYFIAGTYVNGNGFNTSVIRPVKTPYYTVSGTENWKPGFALPLNNAFRVKIETAKQQQIVAGYEFTFELTMPECPVTRDYNKTIADDKSILWTKESKDRNGNDVLDDVLKVYGEKSPQFDGIIYGDLRDAFINAFENKSGVYTATPEAGFYNIYVDDVNQDKVLLGQTNRVNNPVTLDFITANSLWSQWNTFQHQVSDKAAGETYDFAEMQANKVIYNHFGVYPEELPMFYVQFASKIEDSQKPTYNIVSGQTGNGEEKTPLMAQTVYKDDKVTLDYYKVTITDANFTLKDVFGYTYKLFDAKDSKGNITKRNVLNNMWANDREGINDNATWYGLNPKAEIDGVAAGNKVWFYQGAAPDAKTGATEMTIYISKDVAAAKNNLVKVTLQITDVFGHAYNLPIYIQTVK